MSEEKTNELDKMIIDLAALEVTIKQNIKKYGRETVKDLCERYIKYGGGK